MRRREQEVGPSCTDYAQNMDGIAQTIDGEQVYRFAITRVAQGKHIFYTLTIPINVLAHTCFVVPREADPELGFQRTLSKQRAQDIADYIDHGFGSIPNSIILSAQPAANLTIVGRGKTMQFNDDPHAFLILDGQHRVYGFRLAKTKTLRVPVVIFDKLSRTDEARLFIDINTKQRPVPNELLLDIKKLASYDSELEETLGELFSRLANDSDSPLIGLMSPSKKVAGKLSRVTVNAALKPVLGKLDDPDLDRTYDAISEYLHAVTAILKTKKQLKAITSPTVFRAFLALFPEVATRVKDRYDGEFTRRNFSRELQPLAERITPSQLSKPGDSYKDFHSALSKYLERKLSL